MSPSSNSCPSEFYGLGENLGSTALRDSATAGRSHSCRACRAFARQDNPCPSEYCRAGMRTSVRLPARKRFPRASFIRRARQPRDNPCPPKDLIHRFPADDLKWRFRHCLAFLSLDYQLLSAQSSQRLGDQLSSFYPTAVRAAPRIPLDHQLADEHHRRFNPQLVGQRPTCHPTRRRDLAKVSKATARTIMMPIMIC